MRAGFPTAELAVGYWISPVSRAWVAAQFIRTVVLKELVDQLSYFHADGQRNGRFGRIRSAGILPALIAMQRLAGWKPALRGCPQKFFRSLLSPARAAPSLHSGQALKGGATARNRAGNVYLTGSGGRLVGHCRPPPVFQQNVTRCKPTAIRI